MGRTHLLMLAVAPLLACISSVRAAPDWRELAPGLELGSVLGASAADTTGTDPGGSLPAEILVVRVDPNRWELALTGRTFTAEPSGCRTAREWAAPDWVLAINAGMYATDYTTHIGFLSSEDRVHSAHVNAYESVAAFGPRDPADPPFRIFDLDAPGVSLRDIRSRYCSVVQNLRLIRRPGENRWSPQPRAWSEVALAEDDLGRVLFLYCAEPLSMFDFNRAVLASGLGVVAAQHLEGGPQAQIYLRVGDFELERVGDFDASFDGNNPTAWPIPTVLGVRKRPEAG